MSRWQETLVDLVLREVLQEFQRNADLIKATCSVQTRCKLLMRYVSVCCVVLCNTPAQRKSVCVCVCVCVCVWGGWRLCFDSAKLQRERINRMMKDLCAKLY